MDTLTWDESVAYPSKPRNVSCLHPSWRELHRTFCFHRFKENLLKCTCTHPSPLPCSCALLGFTSFPRRAFMQASEASQMAVRSCPPSRARATRPSASVINCFVKWPKPTRRKIRTFHGVPPGISITSM